MSLRIEKNGSPINATNKSIKINYGLDHKGNSASFKTEENIEEWDTIEIIETIAAVDTTLFSGTVEKIKITGTGSLIFYNVFSSGWKRFFDRKKIAERYENMNAGDIVKDIISDWTEEFTNGDIEDGILIETVVFNYLSPSEAISSIAARIGFVWRINNDKTIDFFEKRKESAPQIITDTSANYKKLKITPDVSELVNSVIIRGGTFLSNDITFKDVGNGEKTQFILPENPHNTSIKVNSISKTLGIKFGEETPTTDFILNYGEKYIENGLHSVLTSSDVLEVTFKYDVPLRLRRKNQTSIDALKILFPATDGIFEKVVNDESLDDRDLANEYAKQQLDLFSNTTIKGSFETYEKNFITGQVLTINAKGLNKEAVINKITAKSLGNGFFTYKVSFATVLFDFEDFLRMLLIRGDIEINEGETVETIESIEDNFGINENIKITIDENKQDEEITLDESYLLEKNKSIVYVFGEYFPSSHSDDKRVFILDSSPLS